MFSSFPFPVFRLMTNHSQYLSFKCLWITQSYYVKRSNLKFVSVKSIARYLFVNYIYCRPKAQNRSCSSNLKHRILSSHHPQSRCASRLRLMSWALGPRQCVEIACLALTHLDATYLDAEISDGFDGNLSQAPGLPLSDQQEMASRARRTVRLT
jgi:hypothetical protein